VGEPLPAGYAVLAEAFGDYVLLRADPVFCPVCATQAYLAKLRRDYLACVHCGLWEPCQVVGDPRWVIIPTESLLIMRKKRYYLPTAWNKEPWIDRKQLAEKFDSYMKEKRECLLRLQGASLV
jgi:hypothetical protein